MVDLIRVLMGNLHRAVDGPCVHYNDLEPTGAESFQTFFYMVIFIFCNHTYRNGKHETTSFYIVDRPDTCTLEC